MTATDAKKRLTRLRRALQQRRLPALLVTSPVHRRYVTGFTGTTGTVLVTPTSVTLFTDFRYAERAAEEVFPGVTVAVVRGPFLPHARKVVRVKAVGRLGYEDDALAVAHFQRVAGGLPTVRLIGASSLLLEVRRRKDATELSNLAAAVQVTEATLAATVRRLRQLRRTKRLPTERQIAAFVRQQIQERHSAELAFPTIVASGSNSARPHHEPTTKRLRHGELLTIDLGAAVSGYHADMTRTFSIGPWQSEQRALYTTCLRAQEAALRYLRRGGRSAAAADSAARELIDRRYAGAFGHSLGHGVGLEVHEAPTLAPQSKDRLTRGMVFSVEPGIYLSGRAGVRIEDLVTLRDGHLVILSRSPKQLKDSIL